MKLQFNVSCRLNVPGYDSAVEDRSHTSSNRDAFSMFAKVEMEQVSLAIATHARLDIKLLALSYVIHCFT